MKTFTVRLSLRYKLLALLIVLPLITLSLYLAMAANLFREDKIAYVFDSNAAVSRSLATQIRMEMNTAYSSMRGIVENFDFPSGQFLSTGKDLFQKNERFHALILFKRAADGSYKKQSELIRENEGAKRFALDEKRHFELIDRAYRQTAFAKEQDFIDGALQLSFRLGESEDKNHMIIIGLYQADDLTNAFSNATGASSLVLTQFGEVAMGKMEADESDIQKLKKALAGRASDGTTETILSDKQTYLISFSRVGVGELVVVSKVNKAKALKAVDVLLVKSILFFVILLASTLMISVFASNQMTGSLRELFNATALVAKGDFNVRVKARSSDEIGGLAESFNFMASEVSRLMKDTAEKARMESELSTVRTVQETLFPAPEAQFGPIQIRGHFEPASECGGDWWSYSRLEDKVFLWIGDATGHGAPAALITSAAKSAASVIESLPSVTPAMALTILNRAIHETSKGQINMTFFVASIDLAKKTLTYASASHDPPYLVRKTGPTATKKDIRPLNEVNGPRLGEQKNFKYTDFAIEFCPGDLIYFYTDGILDVQDPVGKKWGERAFLKSIVESSNLSDLTQKRLEHIRDQIQTFRNGSTLIDDVTMVVCEFEKRTG